MNYEDAVNNIDIISKKILKTNDMNLNLIRELELVLINLKIEQTRIHENNGISHMADKLEKTIKIMESNIKKLKSENRADYLQSIDFLLNDIKTKKKDK